MLWQPKRLELWQIAKTFLICNKNLFYTLLYQLSYTGVTHVSGLSPVLGVPRLSTNLLIRCPY